MTILYSVFINTRRRLIERVPFVEGDNEIADFVGAATETENFMREYWERKGYNQTPKIPYLFERER